MAWRIVQQPNGLLARFSDVVDNFTHSNMHEQEALNFCIEKLGVEEGTAKVQRALDAGLTRYQEEIDTIREVHGEAEAWKMAYILSQKTKLFLSFTGLLDDCAEKRVTTEELDDALFVFGTTRERIIEQVEEEVQLDRQRSKETCRIIWKEVLIPMLLRAEQEGRVLWRTIEQEITYTAYKAFLEQNNIIVPSEFIAQYPSYPGVKKVLRSANPHLEIFS